jgi:hypothetical protein
VLGRIRSIEKSNDLIGNRTLPACSTVPQPTMLPRAPILLLLLLLLLLYKQPCFYYVCEAVA